MRIYFRVDFYFCVSCSDKTTTVSEEEYNARNRRHFSSEAKGYQVQGSNKEESRYQGTSFPRAFTTTAGRPEILHLIFISTFDRVANLRLLSSQLQMSLSKD